MKFYKALAALMVAPTLTLTQVSLAQNLEPTENQKLSIKAKPAVVRVISPCFGTYDWKSKYSEDGYGFTKAPLEFDLDFIGTGFFINPGGYIVTSANVIQNKKDCEQRLRSNVANKINVELNEIDKYGKLNVFHTDGKVILPNVEAEPLPFEIKKSARQEGTGGIKANQDIAVIKIALQKSPTLKLGDSSQVKFGDPIITIGFPANDLKNLGRNKNQVSAKSLFEASVLEGGISSSSKQLEGGYPVLFVDIQSTEGIGGSPLINRDGQVIGMLTYNKEEPEPVPLAIPTSTIEEYIRESGVINQEGTTDTYYREGLNAYWKENYEEAKAKFENVKGLFANHSEAQRFVDDINQKLADRYSKPWTNPTYRLLAALIAGLTIVGIILFLLLRRQFKAKQSAGSPRPLAQDGSVLKASGKGDSPTWLELEYKGQHRRCDLYKTEHRLGRDSAWSDFEIPSNWEVISRHHLILKKEGEDYRIYNEGRNGLWIDNDIQVDSQEGYPLTDGDKLTIGKDPNEQVILSYFNSINSKAKVRETKVAE